MRFELSEDAAALRAAADGLLAQRATPAVVRAGWTDAGDADVRAVWRGLGELGVLGALVPESAGGLGLTVDALAPLLERLGETALPVPAVETVAVAAPLLAAAGHPALPGLLTGDLLVAAQLTDGSLLPFGGRADYVLLADAAGGLRLHERADLDAEPVTTVDGSRHATRLRSRPTGGVLLAAAGPTVDAAWQRGVLGTAAVLVGLAARMLSLTVDYVRERRQFGVPVGSFQAVKHRLADALVAVEFARPAVLAAGWAQATGAGDAAEQTSVAKVLASDAATVAARAAIQCHGAIGYTTEYDLHLYAKRAWALAPSLGSADRHRRQLAGALGLTPEKERTR